MYKFISIARNPINVWSTPMYVYQNEENKKYYITRMYPINAKFYGSKLEDLSTYSVLEYPKEISDADIAKKTTTYWNIEWTLKL